MPWTVKVMLPWCCFLRLARICRAWSGLSSIARPVADRLGPMIRRCRNLVPPGIGSSSNRHWALGRSGSLTFQANTLGGHRRRPMRWSPISGSHPAARYYR